jgi:hypothetical protein
VKRSNLGVIAVCSAALFVPLVFPLMTGRVFTKDDLAAWHIPFRFVYWTALRRGDSLLWTRAVLSGVYLHGEGEVGLMHPLHLALYRILPLGPAVNLEIIATYVAVFAGSGLLFARLGLARDAAWFGAMLFAFSGFFLFNLMHVNHLAALAHLPWLLWTAHLLLTSDDRRRRTLAFIGFVVVAASQWLVGNPQYVWISYLAVAYLTACTVLDGAPYARAGLLAAALALGAAVGAVQLLPTLDFARASVRSAWSSDQMLSFSLSPLNLVQLWSPFAFRLRVHAPPAEAEVVHEFIVYNGAFCTIALAWIAIRWRPMAHRRLAGALLVLAALALVLAFGRYGPYAWIASWPGFRNFRAPARHVALFQLAQSGLAAIAFEDLTGVVRRGEPIAPRRSRLLLVPAAIGLLLTAGAVRLEPTMWASAHHLTLSSAGRAWPWTLPMIVVATLVMIGARGTAWAVPILIVCTAGDLGAWGYSYAYRWGPLRSIDELAATAEVPPHASPGDLIVPIGERAPQDLALLRGFRLTSGYNGIEPASALDWNDSLTARIAGAVWRPAGSGWAPVRDPMPRARLVSEARVSTNPGDDVRTIDIRRIALVDRPVGTLSGLPGTASIATDRAGSIVVDTASDSPQLLVVTERFHQGWRAAQDGRERESVRVNGDFLGVVVDAGRHRVAFAFQPDSMRRGLQTSVAGVVLTGVISILLWPRRSRGTVQVAATI